MYSIEGGPCDEGKGGFKGAGHDYLKKMTRPKKRVVVLLVCSTFETKMAAQDAKSQKRGIF